MRHYVAALFTLTRYVLIMNSIMQISKDKQHYIHKSLKSQFSFTPLIHMEPAYVAKLQTITEQFDSKMFFFLL